MKASMKTPSVVDFTVQVLQMDQRIGELEAEVDGLRYFREEYFKLLEQQHNHTQRLFGIGILGALSDLKGAKVLVNS